MGRNKVDKIEKGGSTKRQEMRERLLTFWLVLVKFCITLRGLDGGCIFVAVKEGEDMF